MAGTIYQAPDLCSVVNSRLLSCVSHLQSAFEEARSYAKYHPSKGYTWDFEPNKNVPLGARRALQTQLSQSQDGKSKDKKTKKDEKPVQETSSMFQRYRVDALLDLLTKKFPFKIPQTATSQSQSEAKPNMDDLRSEKGGGAESVKSEKNDQTSEQRGIKREAPVSSNAKPGQAHEQHKKMKYS